MSPGSQGEKLEEKFSDIIVWTMSFYQVQQPKSWVLSKGSLSFFWKIRLSFLALSYFGLDIFWNVQKAWWTRIWKLGEKVLEKKTQWPNPKRNCPRRNCRCRKNILPNSMGIGNVAIIFKTFVFMFSNNRLNHATLFTKVILKCLLKAKIFTPQKSLKACAWLISELSTDSRVSIFRDTSLAICNKPNNKLHILHVSLSILCST